MNKAGVSQAPIGLEKAMEEQVVSQYSKVRRNAPNFKWLRGEAACTTPHRY